MTVLMLLSQMGNGQMGILVMRLKRSARRLFWSLAAGVLLVPVVSAGALAVDPLNDVHAKESRAVAHSRVAVDQAAIDAEHEAAHASDCAPLVEFDHAPFATDAEHKAFHGIPTEIDHSGDPEFATAAEHKAFHGIPCGVGGLDRDEADHESAHEADATSRDVESGADNEELAPNELKEQPEDSSQDEDPSADHSGDRSERNEERSQERNN